MLWNQSCYSYQQRTFMSLQWNMIQILTDYAASRRVIICGPSTLIMLLRVASHLWRQASIEKEAQDIKKCGEEIYKSACLFVEKFASIGKRIQSLENQVQWGHWNS